MVHRSRNTRNGGGGGGRGTGTSTYFFNQECILNKFFTVCKHKSLLLQLGGWLLMNRKVYLMYLALALALTIFSPNGASGPVSNP